MKQSLKILIYLFLFLNSYFLFSEEEIKNTAITNLLNLIKLNNGNKFDNERNSLNINFSNTPLDSISDTLTIQSDSSVGNNPQSYYIPSKDFKYADNPKYTITGNLPLNNTKLKPLNTAIVGGVSLGIFVLQHELQQNTIWKEVGDFHISEDIQYALWVDKLGHFYGGYLIGYIFNEALLTCGFSYDLSTILGGILGLSYQTYIEVLDGMSVNWGFSPSDFYADILGSAFFVAQRYIPFLQNFTPKFSYVNPQWLGEKDRIPHDSFIDNYSAQNFWMSINIRNIFGGSVRHYLPDWLQLSVGYAAYSLCNPGSGLCDPNISTPISDDVWGNRKIIISLDYDLVKLLPDGPPIWNWFKQSLNMIKFPAPALQIGFEGDVKFFILYPFRIF